MGQGCKVSMKLTKNEYLLAGSFSGFVSRAVVQPLDVLKIRFQLQVEPIKTCKTSKYHGLLQAIRCINKEEGIFAFWKGHVPAQLQAVAFSGVQFLSFEVLLSWMHSFDGLSATNRRGFSLAAVSSPLGNFVCGCFAGSIAAGITQPLDVLRTRFIAQGEPKVYGSLQKAAYCILSREGVQGFFRGLSPSLLLIAPQTGMQFAIYHAFNQLVSKLREHCHKSGIDGLLTYSNKSENSRLHHVGTIQSMIAGGIAGMGAKCVVYPLDMAKKRMQVRGFEEARLQFGRVPNSHGLRGCLMEIWHNEGATAIFKGLRPTLLKSCVSISCRFTVYEQICKLILQYRHSDRTF